MPKKLLKPVLTLLALIISPLIIGAVASVLFIVVHIVNGDSFSAAGQALAGVFNDLLSFLPLITGIPAALIVFTAIFMNRNRIKSWFRK